ncbi:MAG TPA: hypothetical protein PK228_21445 [Saprospiraceae bacterium]|nr:hypothetical protein [Saprospiraceae bacterium]
MPTCPFGPLTSSDYTVNPLGLNIVAPFPKYAVLTSLSYPSFDNPNEHFDIVIPESAIGPVPLVIFLHGGGGFDGDKSHGFANKYKPMMAALLKANIAYTSIDYSLLKTDGTEADGLKKPLYSITQFVQYIRHHAVCLNIKKGKIGIFGVSFGANAATWLAFNKEMKNQLATDYKKQSTLVQALVTMETQCSNDMRVWANQIFNSVPFSLICIKNIIEEVRMKAYYPNLVPPPPPSPLTTSGQVSAVINEYITNTPNYLAGTGNINLDMLDLMSEGDPPIWLESFNEPAGFPSLNCLPSNREQLVHHPYHPKALLDRAKQINLVALQKIKYVARINALGIFEQSPGLPNYAGKTAVDFLIDRLQ